LLPGVPQGCSVAHRVNLQAIAVPTICCGRCRPWRNASCWPPGARTVAERWVAPGQPQQPIVDLQTAEVIGVEALARSTHPALSTNPAELLALAEQCGMAVELSQLFRRLAVQHCQSLASSTKLFLNVHPRELTDLGLIDSIAALGAWRDTRAIVIEIPESAVTNVTAMAALRAALRDLAVEFAYDDFGTGQTRLLEMTAVPPHYLKFDTTMIQGIETAPAR
jgi:EAL domain-containing protein (putative c-di-GMP-specific phosphodiesterase class I)